jgi:DNA-directed RNA polymerase I subunit RPA1
MAHEVRVLHSPTQKTIRMHYANCNTYNADYDGDEMNCHFPQSDLGRAEAKFIAKTDLQYIVPTDGTPLRGLIQDHVVGGVKLTKRDTFLEKWEFQQLLFAALASLPGLELIRSDSDIELMPPAILKPKVLWTGKQVISTLLNHLRKGNDRDFDFRGELPGLSTERKAKTAGAAFGDAMEEHLVIIRDGELLRGVLDKAAFGATDFGLVHAVFEAYGPSKAGLLLNSLGRLFTAYIQFYSGHSCRMEDLVLTKEADEKRRNLINKAYANGSRAAKAWADSEGGKVPIETDETSNNEPLKPVEAASAASKVRQLLSGSEGKSNHAALDGFMMSKLNPLASDIVKACLPGGLAVPFPTNTFGIMCGTGAKGSIVNQSQVSCALGQQALEGRRVPRLSSGRTLPSFAPYDVNPRSDGFVMDRFLTGIRPQEYYFHCMAGREGLVDTAVKTSRSGYLQRCLVKHLEELKINYDFTVRNGEGGVVQFLYGEDGLDPTKCAYLDCTDKSFTYMARNHASLKLRQTPLPDASIAVAAKDAERARHFDGLDDHLSAKTVLSVGDRVKARKLRVGSKWTRGALCEGWFDAIVTKRRKKEGTYDIEYTEDRTKSSHVPTQVNFDGGGASSKTCQLLVPASGDPILSVGRGSLRLGSSGLCISERIASAAAKSMESSVELQKAMKSNNLSKDDFGKLVAAKYTAALADPGEAVGAIAAQSIGEPSTQMTLNTFHLAGAGANVTLGIPRLREIIMTASRELKTPTMSVPLNDTVCEKEMTKLTRSFTKLTLNELIAGHHGVTVRETLTRSGAGMWERAYYVTLKLHPAERIKTAFGISLQDIARVVAKSFIPALSYQMKLELRRSSADMDDGKKVDVDVAESSTYLHKVRRRDDDDNDDEEEEQGNQAMGRNSAADQDDPLEKDEDDDDDDEDDEVDLEDGVMASRRQEETYDEVEEDHDDEEEGKDATKTAPASSISDDESEDEDKGDRPAAQTDIPFHEEFYTDAKTNTIHLPPMRVDPSARPLLMVGLVEIAATKTLVRSKKKIDEAFLNDEEGRGRCLQTAGINFEEIWKLDCVDHSRLMSNDIWAVRCSYGVEAARNNIVDQIRSVFGVYGIEVDPRHLSLIGDYMTFGGDYTPMNRTGMREMSSPFLQMSFETTAQFMTQAALTGTSDDLNSPSANIVVGRPVRHGTGSFTLMVK